MMIMMMSTKKMITMMTMTMTMTMMMIMMMVTILWGRALNFRQSNTVEAAVLRCLNTVFAGFS